MVTLGPSPLRVLAARPRVEILGVFGSGKTTLAAKLAGDMAEVLAESHAKNPFWGNPEATSVTGYLAYDLSFLLQHAHLAATPATGKYNEVGICDWSLASDRLWASMRLGDDFAAYDIVYHALLERIGAPIGYLYLRQPPDLILSRLHKRGRAPEVSLEHHVAAAVDQLDNLVRVLPAERVVIVHDDTEPAVFQEQIARWKAADLHA